MLQNFKEKQASRMQTKFPLLCGHLSLDLVNTEVVRRGQRIDLLPSARELNDWLQAVGLSDLWDGQHAEAMHDSLLVMRHELRWHFETIAEQQTIPPSLVQQLEAYIERAPFTYRLVDGKLRALPVGEPSAMLQSLIALDVLKLIADDKLRRLKRCANEDCVLLFLDESGRRKWCSMKICGNRQKVAQFQQRQSE